MSLTGTPFIIRKQNYWSMLAGACGVTLMNVNWSLGTGWDTELTTEECFTQIIHLKNLFEAYQWHNMVPDTSNQVLTAGYGTKRTGTGSDPLPALRAELEPLWGAPEAARKLQWPLFLRVGPHAA